MDGHIRHTQAHSAPYNHQWTPLSSTWNPLSFHSKQSKKRELLRAPEPKVQSCELTQNPPKLLREIPGTPRPSLRAPGPDSFEEPTKPLGGLGLMFVVYEFGLMRGGEGEMLYCITNRLNKGLISVDRNKRMLLYYLQYPVPTFKSSAKDLSHPIFGIVFQRATDTACFAAPARLKFMALEKHEASLSLRM